MNTIVFVLFITAGKVQCYLSSCTHLIALFHALQPYFHAYQNAKLEVCFFFLGMNITTAVDVMKKLQLIQFALKYNS